MLPQLIYPKKGKITRKEGQESSFHTHIHAILDFLL